MSKRVFIAEKPSVAREFAASLGLSFTSRDGYMEAEDTIVTWCVLHREMDIWKRRIQL